MSVNAAWFHPATPGGSTRLYMAGAFVGALAVLAFSVLGGWPGFLTAATPTDPATVAANAAVGSCLTWTRPDAGDLRAVDCSAPHLFEVTGTADISGQYPAGAPFPDGGTWQKAAQGSCTEGATGYLGKLDPNGKYVVGALKPTGQQWSSGGRTLHCGLQSSTPSGALLPTTGSARGQDQSDVYPAGTCLALQDKAAGGPVPCTATHSYEVVGVVDLQGQFPNGYPPVNQQQTALGKLCAPVAAGYTGGADLGKYGLTLTWDTIQQNSWDAGSHRVNCKIGAMAPDGSGLSPVTNSIKGIGGGAGAPASGSAPPTG